MIQDYLKAAYPALCVLTPEPHRAEQLLPCEGWRFFAWDCIQGIKDIESRKIVDETRNPVEAVNWLNQYRESVLILHNLHLFMDIPEVIQSIQNNVVRWKATSSAIVIISPTINMAPEIEKFIHVIDMPFPNDDELYQIQQDMGKNLDIEPDRKTVFAAKGLTEYEAETAFALSLIREQKFSTQVISEAKAQMIKKSGLMQFWEPAQLEDVGGLDNLKSFINNRARAYLPENSHLPKMKGILLVGIPGTGKSLSSKATASILGWPLIRLDIGSLKNSLVGESERRMRQATHVIDAFGRAVIWIDELEKAFAGTKSSGETDSGTTASMFGHFLTWMSETTTEILVMATANNISQLPPELMRAGRFDATFFVDLPTVNERTEIIGIMNRKWGSDIPDGYADKLNGYTGAEIEQLAKDSLFEDVDTAFNELVPLSKTMKEEIQSLQEWAKNRARFANAFEEVPGNNNRRIRTVI